MLGAATLKHMLISEPVGRTHGASAHLGVNKLAAGADACDRSQPGQHVGVNLFH